MIRVPRPDPLRDHPDHYDFVAAETARRGALFWKAMEDQTGEVVTSWRDSLDAYESRLSLSEQLADRLEVLRPGAATRRARPP